MEWVDNMKDIERMIELENIIIKYQETLSRLIAYSVRGLLKPYTFTLELAKIQKQTLSRCLALVPESDKEKLIRQLERLMKQ